MKRSEPKPGRVIRIVLLSDTHGQHRALHLPGGDLLIHAGDFTLFNRSRDSVRDFDDWMLRQRTFGRS